MKYYSGFSKRFIGLGLMMSYKDTPISINEQIIFDLRAGFYKFWLIIDVKRK